MVRSAVESLSKKKKKKENWSPSFLSRPLRPAPRLVRQVCVASAPRVLQARDCIPLAHVRFQSKYRQAGCLSPLSMETPLRLGVGLLGLPPSAPGGNLNLFDPRTPPKQLLPSFA